MFIACCARSFGRLGVSPSPKTPPLPKNGVAARAAPTISGDKNDHLNNHQPENRHTLHAALPNLMMHRCFCAVLNSLVTRTRATHAQHRVNSQQDGSGKTLLVFINNS